MEAIGNALPLSLPPKPSVLLVGIREILCPITCYLFSTVLSLLSTKRKGKQNGIEETSHVDDFLGIVGNVILIPLIRSFVPFSRSYAAAILAERPSAISITDVRSDSLYLLTEVISALNNDIASGTSQSARYLRERLVLEAVRQIEALYPDPAITTDTPSISSRSRRIDRLGDKDALAYVCNVLCLMFTSPSVALRMVTTTSPDSGLPAGIDGLLRGAIVTSLSDLLRRTGSGNLAYRSDCGVGCSDTTRRGSSNEGNVVDEVGYNMMLATIERAWLFW